MNCFVLLCYYIPVGEQNISHIQVFRGHDVHLNCSDGENSSKKHLWWFGEDIVFSRGHAPDELQLENVFGNMSNGSNSFLHIYHFTDDNEGYYNCTESITKVIVVYHLSLAGTFTLLGKMIDVVFLWNR